MSPRFYSFVLVITTGLLSMALQPDLPCINAKAQTKQDSKVDAYKLLQVGSQQFNKSQYREALQSYQSALDIYRSMNNRNGEGASLIGLGNVYNRLGDYQKAIDLYQQSLNIFNQIDNRKGQGIALNVIGDIYNNLGQYQKAIEYSQNSLVISKQIGDRNSEGIILGNLGNTYNKLGQYQKAIEFYQQSLAIVQKIGDRNSEGNSLNNLGAAFLNLGQSEKAIDFYEQSLRLFNQIGDRSGEGVSLLGLGNVYNRLGQYQRAIDLYQQSLVIKKQIGDRNGEGNLLGNLGTIYRDLGQYQKAIDYHQQSLAIFKQTKDRNSEAIVLGNLSVAYNNLEQYQKAIDFSQQSLAIKKQIGDHRGEGISLTNLGNAYIRLGQYQKAIESFQQSLIIAKQIGDRYGEGSSLANISFIYLALGQYQKAIDSCNQSLEILRQIGDRYEEKAILSILGHLFTLQNQTELAILFFKQSVNVNESIRKDIRGLKVEEQISYLGIVSNSYKFLASLLLKQGRIIEALQVLDLLKFQELEDYLKNVKGSDRSAEGVRLLAPEKSVSDKLLVVSSDNGKEINSQLTNQIQQLPKSEINKVPEYLQNIPQGTVLLYPLILEDRIEIVLFSPKTSPVHRTINIKKEEFEDLVFAYRLYLKDPKTLKIRDASKQLYDVLIKPIEEDLKLAKATTILYSPDDVLRYVPLAALYDGKQWLVEKYRISNLIAYNLTDFTPKAKSSPSILAGAYGNGNPKTGQIPLPATIKEVSAISNTFPNTVNLIESAFSFSATEAQIPKHNILHLATHAQFNGNPNTSFIYFGNGDTVSLSKIKDWKMNNIDLIVLSACQTGSGKLGNGIEILGFGYQVQLAGAKASIASLWKVNDEGTQALMKSFYENIKQGDRPTSEALRQAQIDTIRSQQFSHPFYWSAFILIGSGL